MPDKVACPLTFDPHQAVSIMLWETNLNIMPAQIAKFMGPTWGPPGSCQPQMGSMLAPWTLLSLWRSIGFWGHQANCSKVLITYVEHICVFVHNTLLWRHNGRDGVSNNQPHDCLHNCLFRCRSKKTSKLRVTGLCVGNSPMTGEFPIQMASNAENAPIW